jgi:hypothetical protein
MSNVNCPYTNRPGVVVGWWEEEAFWPGVDSSKGKTGARMQADWDRSKTGKSLITYGFLFGLLVLMVMMLAVTPMPGWMDESNDEVRLGGPNTKLDAGEPPSQHTGPPLLRNGLTNTAPAAL